MHGTDSQTPFSDMLKKNPPVKPTNKASGRQREYLTETELDALMDAAKQTGRNGFRDYVLIMVAYRHALRVGELVGLRWDAIDFTRAEIHVARLKHGDPSVQPLSGSEMRCLRKLRRDYPDSPFVFSSERRGPISERAIHRIIAAAGRKAKISFPVHPHQLRHTCGYQLANKGVDTRAIQGYLGHKNIAHTVRYSQLAAGRFKEIGKLL
jgi:type 1 fimbriae regulatory protein FimE